MAFDVSPLWISLRTSVCAGVIVFVLGLCCARACLYAKGWVKWLTDVLFTLPLVLPPTVLGYFLLIAIGKNSPLGQVLMQWDVSLIFTWPATVIAAVVVAFPLMYRAAKGALEQVDMDMVWAARTLGMNEWRIFIRIMLPQAWPGIAAGLVLAFARALGEFGATMMIAGNIPGQTQTIPMAIYFATAAGNMRTAGIWVAIITAVSCLALAVMQYYQARAARTRGKGLS